MKVNYDNMNLFNDFIDIEEATKDSFIKNQLQYFQDVLEGGIWYTNIKEGAITGVLSDSLYNTKIGTEALYNNVTGYNNSALGYQNLYSNISGYDNITLGYKALYSATAAYHNIALGNKALYSNTTGYHNIAFGNQALYSNNGGYHNIAIGHEALYSNITDGRWNIALGYQVMYSNTTSVCNIALGYQAMYSNTIGTYNVSIGYHALYNNTGGYDNIAISYRTLRYNTTGIRNIAIGVLALDSNTEGEENIGIGYQAGHLTTTGSRNIFIGNEAGRNETGSDKLYIDNSNTTTPLIYGDFDANILTTYGNLGIGTKTFGTSATRTLVMLNGTIPSTSPANAIQLYAEDVTASSELKVRDEATNVTTLSPHNFELFKPDKNDPYPWSYHSINQLIGKKINADISGALRELEVLTGKKFLYYEDVDKISLDEYMEEKKEQLIANYIAENGSEVEVEKDEAWGEVEVEVQDIKEITGYDTKYEFDEKKGKVKEIKKPKYGKKTVLKNKLKKGYGFNEETGKFLKKIKPTESEAEKAIKKELVIPKWTEDRL